LRVDELASLRDVITRRRTKILATLGPSTDAPGVLDRLVEAGMDCARVNCSHGDAEDLLRRAQAVRDASERSGKALQAIGEPAGYHEPSLSKDDTKVLFGRSDGGVPQDIYLQDLSRGNITRLTFDSAPNATSVFSPDESQVLFYSGTTVAYESPHRVEATFEELAQMAPERKLCFARELTKLHEEVVIGTAQELLMHFKNHPPRGEFVLLISPPTERILFEDLSLAELVEMFQRDLQLGKTEAIKMAAQMRGVSKKEVYKKFAND